MPATAASRRNSGGVATPSATAPTGLSGVRPTAARASPCRPWVPATARPRRASATSWSGSPMLSEARCREIADGVLAASRAQETEVFIESGRSALTRFANNVIHQNVAEEGLQVSVRVVADGRTARATTNKTDKESLQRTAEQALTIARWQPEDPDLLPLPGPQRYTRVARVDPKTAELTAQDRAPAVRAGVDRGA